MYMYQDLFHLNYLTIAYAHDSTRRNSSNTPCACTAQVIHIAGSGGINAIEKFN